MSECPNFMFRLEKGKVMGNGLGLVSRRLVYFRFWTYKKKKKKKNVKIVRFRLRIVKFS